MANQIQVGHPAFDAGPAEREEERSAVRTETVPIGGVLGRERLTVVLGAPGSGKSTLMRCLAMALCRPGEKILDAGVDGSGDQVPASSRRATSARAAERSP